MFNKVGWKPHPSFIDAVWRWSYGIKVYEGNFLLTYRVLCFIRRDKSNIIKLKY